MKASIDMRLLAILVCVSALWLAGCAGAGTSGRSMSRVAATGKQDKSEPAIVAHIAGRLKGDEEDDDAESKTLGAHPNGDGETDTDDDTKDNAGKGYYDGDEGTVRDFGHAARTADRRAVEALVKGYFTVARADDGAAGCRLLYSLVSEAVPEDFGEGAGAQYLRGKTCAAVMTKLFAHERSWFAGTNEIVTVRVSQGQARALLGSTTQPARYLRLHREHGAWRVMDLIGTTLP